MGLHRFNPSLKSEPDSLEGLLRTEKRRQDFFEYVERNKLVKGQAHLLRAYGIKRDPATISRWAIQRRTSLAFSERLTLLRQSTSKGRQIAGAIGDVSGVTEANVALLSSALLEAQLAKNAKEMKLAANLLFLALQGIAKNKSGDAQLLTARTQHEKFQTDVAKLALQHAAELQEINRGKGSDRDKTERAKIRLFGPRPGAEALKP